MSQLNVDTIKNRLGTAGPTVPSLSITNDATVGGALLVTNNATVGGALTVTGNETVSGNLSVSNNATVGGALTVTGNFTVNGTQTIINTVSLDIIDGTIGIGSTSTPSDSLADGDGIVIYGTTNKSLTYNNTKKGFETNVAWATTETRFINVAEKHVITSGNTVNLTYNGASSNIGLTTNPTGNITLNVTGIPTSSDFDSHTLTFSVFVNQTGTARSCTAVTLNGRSATIRWAGGSLANATAGVTTTSGMDIYSFTGINTVGSASTTANYYVMGVVNGGYR